MDFHLPGALVRLAYLLTQLAYRLSGGSVGEKQWRYSMLLLHTVGRKTGKRRTHALLYLRDGERFIVCASNNGEPRHPAWYLNLRANPRAHIQAGRLRQVVVASTADAEERERLWQRLLKVYPSYAEEQQRTTRIFPVVILTPVPAHVSDGGNG